LIQATSKKTFHGAIRTLIPFTIVFGELAGKRVRQGSSKVIQRGPLRWQWRINTKCGGTRYGSGMASENRGFDADVDAFGLLGGSCLQHRHLRFSTTARERLKLVSFYSPFQHSITPQNSYWRETRRRTLQLLKVLD
jgi:hypothetical protein